MKGLGLGFQKRVCSIYSVFLKGKLAAGWVVTLGIKAQTNSAVILKGLN